MGGIHNNHCASRLNWLTSTHNLAQEKLSPHDLQQVFITTSIACGNRPDEDKRRNTDLHILQPALPDRILLLWSSGVCRGYRIKSAATSTAIQPNNKYKQRDVVTALIDVSTES